MLDLAAFLSNVATMEMSYASGVFDCPQTFGLLTGWVRFPSATMGCFSGPSKCHIRVDSVIGGYASTSS